MANYFIYLTVNLFIALLYILPAHSVKYGHLDSDDSYQHGSLSITVPLLNAATEQEENLRSNYKRSYAATQEQFFNETRLEEQALNQEARRQRRIDILKIAIPCTCICTALAVGVTLLIHFLPSGGTVCYECLFDASISKN